MGPVLAMIRNRVLCAATVLLVACGSDKDAMGGLQQVRSVVGGVIGLGKGKSAPAVAEVTRAQITALGAPQIRIKVPARNGVAFLGIRSTSGRIVTWQTSDGISLTLRDGILLETRGFGEDLMSAQVPAAAQISTSTGPTARAAFYLDGADRTIRHDFACTLAPGGPAVIEVLERTYDTRRVTETCTGPTASFTNQYWFEASGKLRKSTQWVSRTVGFLELEMLVDADSGPE